MFCSIHPLKGHVRGSGVTLRDRTPNALQPAMATGSETGRKLILLRMLCTRSEDYFVQGLLMRTFSVRTCFGEATNKSHYQS